MIMPREEKAAWLYFLRSGEIQQARAALMLADGSCCCIGVLCDRVHKLPKELITDRVDPENDEEVFVYQFNAGETKRDRQTQILPESLRIRYEAGPGAIDITGIKDRRGDRLTLAQLNDEGFTFDQIADIIEYFVEEEA